MEAINFDLFSHLAGAILYLILTFLLSASWKGRIEGGLLLLASVISTLWFALLSIQAIYHVVPNPAIFSLEILRNIAWFTFFLRILGYRLDDFFTTSGRMPLFVVMVYVLSGLLLGAVLATPLSLDTKLGLGPKTDLVLLGFVLLSVTGLVLVEQLFRNTESEHRWAIKFLCLGVGAMFAYDFYMYSDALLFKRIDRVMWDARGAINAMVVPLIAVSASRKEDWSVKLFVSKKVVFHTATLLGAGTYLIVMAATGYYLQKFGGMWGIVARVIFLFGALILLFVLLFSGQVRARLKFFLNKHFFGYKYDYREEWLGFIQTLSEANGSSELRERSIRAIGEIVESPGGLLWMKEGSEHYAPVARYAMPEPDIAREPANGSLVEFLAQREWVIDVSEYEREPELYANLRLPEWLTNLPRAWLVVPLFHQVNLIGFVVLAESRANFSFNWEDTDLLKTVGRQAAGYLALLKATEELTDARQFEAFNRLSAFVVHDLKNLVAQLSLVVTNAKRHMHNPEFVQDAIQTVENAVLKMNRLLEQLRKDRKGSTKLDRVDLCEIAREVVKNRSAVLPNPDLECAEDVLKVFADRDRLVAVIEHLVQNAQEASADNTQILVRLARSGGEALIEVIDNGAGMDETFIRERLFRPFDTTKGNAGMGVGAYETREYVRELGGNMHVMSSIGDGTTVALTLNLVPGGDQESELVLANTASGD